MERSRLIPCPNNEEVKACCPEYPNCKLTKHHEVKQELQRRTLQELRAGLVTPEYYQTVKRYIQHPMHMIVACRWIHTKDLDPTALTELPPEEEMISWLERQENERVSYQ